ncbi:MAG: outer membrane protein assembly factor BamE [Rhodospirillales bacterium]|nr:outer membrane protein assembly factor BamE [Rhodospirillales bacterium]
MASPPVLIRRLTRSLSVLALAAASMTMGACAPQFDTHGDHIEADRIAQIHPGVQRRDDVQQVLGSPSSVSAFGEETWYYISDVVERRSFFNREVVDRQVVSIRFDPQGVVGQLDVFGLERGREVEVVDRETPSFGESPNFLDQIIGNLGRFNRDESAGAPGGRTTRPGS